VEEIPCSVAKTEHPAYRLLRGHTASSGRQRLYVEVLVNVMRALKFVKLEAVKPTNP